MGEAKERGSFFVAALLVEVAFLDDVRWKFEFGFAEGAAETVDALAGVGEGRGAADHGEVLVAERDEMFGGLVGAVFVHAGDGVAGPAIGEAVDVDHGGAGFAVGFGHGGRGADVGGHDDEAGGKVGLELAEIDLFFGEVVVGVAEEEAQAIAEGGVFGAFDDGGEEGVRDVGDDHRDDVGLVSTEAAGELVGLIAKLLDGGHDTLAVDFADGGQAAEDVGDGAEGDVGEPSDLLHVGQVAGSPCVWRLIDTAKYRALSCWMKPFKYDGISSIFLLCESGARL